MADHLERIGQIVGDYRLLRWLGGGGFGNVYLAEQVHGGQKVAVKMLQIRLSKPDDLRAFINETRTIRLRHPHIMPLLDFGLSREDTPFLVMEYASNGTLRDSHPKGARVPLPTAVEYATQVASALQYAHEHQLVHRDVKPENMLVRSDGTILLSDFGIATAAHSTYSISTKQEMVGTVPYMAPEQLAGKPRAASDQYGLAVVIYEWLARRTPFQGTAIEIAMQHATQEPPSLVIQAPEVSREVETILFKALAKDYRERFASMQEFINTLQHASVSPATFRRSAFSARNRLTREASASSTPPVVPSPAVERQEIVDPSSLARAQATPRAKLAPGAVLPGKLLQAIAGSPFRDNSGMAARKEQALLQMPKRYPSQGVVALLLVLVILLIAGGSYIYSTVSNMQTTAMTVSRFATVTVREASTEAARATATAVVNAAGDAYNANVAQHGIMFGFDSAHTRNNPYEYILNGTNVSQLHLAWTALTGNDVRSSPAVANGVVYVGSDNGKLYAFDATTGQPKWIVSTRNEIYSSPAVANGVVYAGSMDGKLYAFDTATGQQKWLALTKGSIYSSPVVANGVVYVGSDDGKLYAFDAATGQPKWTALTGGSIDSSPAVANGVVYVGSDDGKLYAFDAATGQQQWTASTGGGVNSSPAVVNGFVYVGSDDGKLYAFDAITGLQHWAASTGGGIGSSPAVVNGFVYVGSENHKVYAFDATTGQQQWVASTGSIIESSPTIADGVVYIGSGDGKLYAFDAMTGQQQWTSLTGGPITYSSPTVANGMVYVGSEDHNLYAFSLPKGAT
jgi:outer membrane protein assembly factor BamB/serine/threonine protein kinase